MKPGVQTTRPRRSSNPNVLMWWKKQQELSLSTLAQIAFEVLSIPATSVPSEQAYSMSEFKFRLQRAQQDAVQNLLKSKSLRKCVYDKNVNSVTYNENDFVLLKNETGSKLDTLYTGPYRVISDLSPNVKIVKDNKEIIVHKNRTKPFVCSVILSNSSPLPPSPTTGYNNNNSNSLPKIDVVMLGRFFAANSDFCSSEFRNVKTSISSRASYVDDAVSYVQLKRETKMCIVKCKICPKHKVHAKLHGCTMVIDEEDGVIIAIQCQDCIASQGGCKHAIVFLMWVHRRGEEPSCTAVECYWKKSKLSRVGSSLKYMTAKDLSKGSSLLPPNSSVFNKFLEEARKRKIEDCELLKYQPNYCLSETQAVSMHQLVYKLKEKCVEVF
ncbi:hypothetical protein evm_014071 [Chilo suppressalis]|nr:hypothetical protein evm_014071 [Chilo suppressalis]